MTPLCSPDWPQIQHIPASLYLQNSRITRAHHLEQSDHEHSSHVKSNLPSISTSTNCFGRAPTRDLVTEHAECLSFHPLQYLLKEAHHPLSRLLQEPSEDSRFPFWSCKMWHIVEALTKEVSMTRTGFSFQSQNFLRVYNITYSTHRETSGFRDIR